MRIFYEPKTYLVARPSLNIDGIVGLLGEYGEGTSWQRDDADGDGDGLAEVMGRLCYGSFGEAQGRVGAMAYLDNILKQRHGSVMEHANWSFVACRAGRGFTHQMVRHDAGFGFSQESTHFIRYDKDAKGGQEPGFCMTGFAPGSQAAQLSADLAEESFEGYARLWSLLRAEFPDDAKGKKKIVSGAARGNLPTSLESRLGFTGNARSLRHFCQVRGNKDNTLEIRLVAAQVAAIMKIEAPAMFQDFFIELDPEDGYQTVHSAYNKV